MMREVGKLTELERARKSLRGINLIYFELRYFPHNKFNLIYYFNLLIWIRVIQMLYGNENVNMQMMRRRLF